MRELSIAYGDSCFSKKWVNKTTTLDDLAKRLESPIRTTETVFEYAKMSKESRDRVKDKGGFVGGHLKEGRRKLANVAYRSMMTLDMDQARTDFLSGFLASCQYTALVYSTHGHKPEAPRLRLIVPLTRDVSVDEHQALARYFAAEWGIDQFDECSYRPHQLMYWPTCPADGEYIFEYVERQWLNPDVYLAGHPNWKDCTMLPTSSRESSVRDPNGQKQEDPLKKTGVVGAFCRTYTITAAIATFLSAVYAPTAMENRYDFIGSDSMPGVQVYEDRWIYSHHATDPACGMLLNAFDMIRVHQFGDGEKSFDEMSEWALKDPEVRKTFMAEKLKGAEEEFSEEDSWMKDLDISKRGEIKPTLPNLLLITRNDPKLTPICYNQHRDGIDVRMANDIPWQQLKPGWSDTDVDCLQAYIAATYGIETKDKIKTAIKVSASERVYHPVKEYLGSLPDWDGLPRLDMLFTDYLGAPMNDYTQAVSRKSLTAAVARIYEPGIKYDSMPVLCGPQGIGKSTLFEKLAGNWFNDSLTMTDMKDKTGPEKLQGYWIIEIGEMAGMRKADVESVKSFLSRQDDKYRASYGENVESHPRQCVLFGSSNTENGFLRDITGNRRFWPIKVTGESRLKSWDMDEETVQQIWAEALVCYHAGEKLYLEGAEAKQAEAEQLEAMETDEREGIVREYLDALLPDDWDFMTLGERRNFLAGSGDIGRVGTVKRTAVCNVEIWAECFGQDPSKLRKQDSYEIAAIMRKIPEWGQGNRMRVPGYGLQRVYQREV